MVHPDYNAIYSKMTKKQKEAAHDAALEYYIQQQGQCSVKTLSRKAQAPQTQVRKWMKVENWDLFLSKDPDDKFEVSKQTEEFVKSEAKKHGLTDQEEMFCYNFLKSRNATNAALKAGYSSSFAHQAGNKLMHRKEVKKFLEDAKTQMKMELWVDAMDVLNLWARIAFADMTDYVTFGAGGVTLRSSGAVDGQLINKVKEGKDGVTIELADRMKALDKLSAYLGILSSDKANDVKLKILQRAEADEDEGTRSYTFEIVGV